MNFLSKIALLILAGSLLTGCEDGTISLAGEAGRMPNDRAYGQANLQNELAHRSFEENVAYLQNLSARFRAEVPTMINFAFDKADLDGEAQQILMRQADWIKANPFVVFRVYGHTDQVGTERYNHGLGMRRARVAVNFLVAQGVPRGQLQAAVSLGETAPLIDSQTRERLNRRTVTDVYGFVQYDGLREWDGKKAVIAYGKYLTIGSE